MPTPTLWDRLRAVFSGPTTTPEPDTPPGVGWLPADANPFGVDVLDVAPLARGARANPADNAAKRTAQAHLARLDTACGTAFSTTQLAADAPRTQANLRFETDPGGPPDGALFRPRVLEEKWALFLHTPDTKRPGQRRILGLRAWSAEPWFELSVSQHHDYLTITSVVGDVGDGGTGSADDRARAADFLLRAHVLGEIVPAPLPPGGSLRPGPLAHALFRLHGRRALAGSHADLRLPRPTRPLRADSAVWLAAITGDLPRLRTALEAGVDPTAKGTFGGATPLHAAAGTGAQGAVEALLEHGVPVDILDDAGHTPLLEAARQHGAPVGPVVTVLLAHGADPTARGPHGTTALHLATRAGRTAVASALLNAGAAVDARDDAGFTALHSAAELGILPLIDALLQRGADPNASAEVDGKGVTPLHLAATRGHADAISRLAEASRG